MHRHAYQGRKLQRDTASRRALVRGLVTSLVMHEQIMTTLAKAKEVAPVFERLVTKAKAANLHSHRQLREVLTTEVAAQKLIQELAPAFADRQGGYTRVIKAGTRRGDNAPMAVVALVLPDKLTPKAPEEAEADGIQATKKPATAKPKTAKKVANV